MTSAFIATVGNDSLPVMTGLAWALRQGRSYQQVLLLEDNPDDQRWAEQRQRLHRWIRGQCPDSGLGQVNAGRLHAELQALNIQHVTANVTGGSKLLALRAAQDIQSGPWQSEVFVVDAHTAPRTLIRQPQAATPAAPLHLREVLGVYAPDARIVPQEGPAALLRAFREALPVPAAPELIRWQGHTYAAALIGSVLHVLWVQGPSDRHLENCADQHSLRAFRQRVLQLGGQLARGYVPNVDTFPPGDREQSQLSALRTRQAGLSRTLKLTQVPTPTAAITAAVPLPAFPPAQPARHVLLSVLGEQPMPTLRDLERLRAAGTLEQVELLVTGHPAVRATARRIASWGDRHGVRVYARPVDAADPTSVTSAVRAALKAQHVTLNLTGGTKGMALAALEAANDHPNVTLTVTHGRQVQQLGGQLLSTPPLRTSLEDLLALHGVRPNTSLARPPVLSELERAARCLLRDEGNEAQFTELVRRTLNGVSGAVGRGFALEYVAYAALKRAYPNADAALGAKIHPVTFQGRQEQAVTGSSEHEQLSKEVDVLAAVNGELIAVEAKWRLDTALTRDLEHLDSGQFGWDLGRFAHVAIVSVEFREDKMKVPAAAAQREGWKQSYWLHRHSELSSTAKQWVQSFVPEVWPVLGNAEDLRL